MANHNVIFEENYFYSEQLQNSLMYKLQIFWVDFTGRFQINPVRNGRGILYEVLDLYTFSKSIIFKSKKKAMQYVVAKLFNDKFNYES